MDDADRATADEEQLIAARIAAASVPRKVYVATGECLFCGEPCEAGRRWCGPECRDDFEVRNA